MPIINTVTGGGGSGKGKVIDGEVTPQSFPSVYPAPDGFVGWSKLTVNAPENLSEENIRKDVTIAGVTGIYDPQPNLQDKTLKPTVFPSSVTYDEGYGGLGTVTVESPDGLIPQDIKAGSVIAGVVGTYDPQPNLQSVTKTPTEFPLSITPSEGYDGLSDVTVNAPAGLRPENIPEGVTIAGVEGTYVGPPTDNFDLNAMGPSAAYSVAYIPLIGSLRETIVGASAKIWTYFGENIGSDNTIKPEKGEHSVPNHQGSFAYGASEAIGVTQSSFTPSLSTYIPSGTSYYWVHIQRTIPEGDYLADFRYTLSDIYDNYPRWNGTITYKNAYMMLHYSTSTKEQIGSTPGQACYANDLKIELGDITVDVTNGVGYIHIPETEVDVWCMSYGATYTYWCVAFNLMGRFKAVIQ